MCVVAVMISVVVSEVTLTDMSHPKSMWTWSRLLKSYSPTVTTDDNFITTVTYTMSPSNGVIGSLGGFMGSLQATEIIKEILEIGESLAGYINLYDVLNNNFRKIKIHIDPECSFCSKYRNNEK